MRGSRALLGSLSAFVYDDESRGDSSVRIPMRSGMGLSNIPKLQVSQPELTHAVEECARWISRLLRRHRCEHGSVVACLPRAE